MLELTQDELEALERIIEDWLAEGFTVPPYPAHYKSLFAKLGVTSTVYDTGE